jgi:hypothetical protein
MKRLFPFLALAILLLAACGGNPTPDLEAGIQAAMSTTPVAELRETPPSAPAATPLAEWTAALQSTPPATSSPHPTATPSPTPTPLRVLFIGNSHTFTNDLPDRFVELMRAGGHAVEAGQSAHGGWSLSDHVASAETLGRIAGGDWDYVVLQERGWVRDAEEEMYPAVRTLDAKIRAAGVETVLFMTWGGRRGMAIPSVPDYESMQAQVAANYLRIAHELDLVVAPVGIAWQQALALDPELELWGRDGSHASLAGTYLAASVFYGVFSGESPEELAYTAGLPEDTVHFLQRVAAETVLAEPEQWTIRP